MTGWRPAYCISLDSGDHGVHKCVFKTLAQLNKELLTKKAMSQKDWRGVTQSRKMPNSGMKSCELRNRTILDMPAFRFMLQNKPSFSNSPTPTIRMSLDWPNFRWPLWKMEICMKCEVSGACFFSKLHFSDKDTLSLSHWQRCWVATFWTLQMLTYDVKGQWPDLTWKHISCRKIRLESKLRWAQFSSLS